MKGWMKGEAKARQVQVDIESMKEYNRILDAQEQSRAAELEARMEKQRVLMEKMKENVVAQQQAKGDEDAMRAERQKAEKDDKKRQALELKRLQASILEADTAEYMEM